MTNKQRNRYLESAEIPRSVQDFIAQEGAGLSVRLLLEYIEELEKLNKNLMLTNAVLSKELIEIKDRFEFIESEVVRLQGKRITQQKSKELLERKARDRKDQESSRFYRNNKNQWTYK